MCLNITLYSDIINYFQVNILKLFMTGLSRILK